MRKNHSSIIPTLNLTALKNDKSKNATALKVRFTSRPSLCQMVQQPLLHNTMLQERSNFTLRQQPIKSSSNKAFDEEIVAWRYANDPFFRQMVKSELSSINKVRLRPQTCRNVDPHYIPIEKTVKLIEEQMNITFRKIKEEDEANLGCERTAFERMIRQGQLNLGKQNR